MFGSAAGYPAPCVVYNDSRWKPARSKKTVTMEISLIKVLLENPLARFALSGNECMS